MEKNNFYLLVGCVAVAFLIIFWYSIEYNIRLLSEISFVIGVLIIYFTRKTVSDLVEDERSARITEKAALRTFQVFWVFFAVLSIGIITTMVRIPSFPPPPPAELFRHPGEIPSPKIIGFLQLGMLCSMIFLYVGFRLYYARKYGDWVVDEE